MSYHSAGSTFELHPGVQIHRLRELAHVAETKPDLAPETYLQAAGLIACCNRHKVPRSACRPAGAR